LILLALHPLRPISILPYLFEQLHNMKLSLFTSVLAIASSALAASLQQVTNYGTNPTNVRPLINDNTRLF
jgi:hypothetical protein